MVCVDKSQGGSPLIGELFSWLEGSKEKRGKSVAFQVSGSDKGQLLELPARPLGLCNSRTRPEQRAESSQRRTLVGEPSAFPLTGLYARFLQQRRRAVSSLSPQDLVSDQQPASRRQQQTRRTISRRSSDALTRGDAESLRRTDVKKCDARRCGRQPLTPPKPIGPTSPLQPIRILFRLLTGADSRLLSDS